MKRFLTMLLALGMGLALLSGCGQTSAPANSTPEVESQSTVSSGEAKLNEPITVYVMVAPGGGLDVRARTLAPYLSERLGVDVTVENVEGGGGVICATQFINQKKGAHDIFMCAASVFTSATLTTEVSYSFEDVVPLGAVDNEQFGLFVCPQKSGLETMDDVIAYGKDNTLIFGSGGVGNVTFSMQDALYKALGLNAETLTHSNAPEGLTNCMGGHNVITMAGLEVARSYVESGDVVPVLTYSAEDYTGYEGYTVPSVTSLEGCEKLTYSGLQFMCVDSSLPQEDIELMQQALLDCLEDPDCAAALKEIGVAEPCIMTPDEVTAHVSAELEMLSGIM